MKIDLRKFNSQTELTAQRELFEECFPEYIGTPIISENHYHWKFHSKKGEVQSAEYAAYDENDIIGYYAAIPYHYRCNGKIMTSAMVCDVMTGVKARGKGIFTKLGIYSTNEFTNQGFDITTGYPIRKDVIPGHIKAGWEIYFELPLYGRFIKFNSFLKKKKLDFLAPVINILFSFYTGMLYLLSVFIYPPNRNLTIGTSCSDKIDSIQRIAEFYNKWETETQISLIKDINFLKWRLGAPELLYHIITLRDQNNIVGVLIAREVEKEGVPCMGIIDLALLKDYHKYAYLLTNELIKIAKPLGTELILVMMGRKWFTKYKLSLNSFLQTPFKFYLIVKHLNPSVNSEMLKNENNWHLMWIDSDNL